MLPAKQFIRVHKSYIIGVTHIKSIYGNSIEMENATIPIGINYKDKVMHLVNKKYLS
ncbi:MAG: LytTR family transcriptional regulator DNA-binding domain-containing protein [Ginsengibacter sp.]